MATTAAPYGLRPINLIGGQQFAGSTRQIAIASGQTTNIFYGDIVAIDATTGTIEKVTATGTDGTTNALPAGVVGVFLGCTYTDPTLKYKLNAQYWPSGTVASDAMAYVCDDPDTLFQVAVVSGTTVVTGVQFTSVGNNATIVDNASSTVSGDSQLALTDSTATTDTLPIRIVDVVPDTAYTSGGNTLYPEVIVKFNFGMHAYETAVGV